MVSQKSKNLSFSLSETYHGKYFSYNLTIEFFTRHINPRSCLLHPFQMEDYQVLWANLIFTKEKYFDAIDHNLLTDFQSCAEVVCYLVALD